MRQFTYTIKDHVNIYLAIFKEPCCGSCDNDKNNSNYEQGVL